MQSDHWIEVNQVGQDPGLCASAIVQDGPWVLTDAKNDIRSLANPLVAGEFGLRFYAKAPLKLRTVIILALCVIAGEISSRNRVSSRSSATLMSAMG